VVRIAEQPHGHGFIAAASMKRAGYERLIAARAIVTTPSSIGWRSTSSTFLRNFGQLVEKQHTAVREAGLRPAADTTRRRSTRRPKSCDAARERDAAHERLAERQRPRDRMDLRGLERLIEAHLGEGRRQAAREHRFFSGSGRPDHQNVVPARGRDLERALGVRLPLHLSEVHVVLGAFGEQPRERRLTRREVRPSPRDTPRFPRGTRRRARAGRRRPRLGEVLPWQD